MALYENGSKKYLSLSLDLTSPSVSYIYPLSDNQKYISEKLFNCCIFISILAFISSIFLLINQNLCRYLDEEISTYCSLMISSVSALSAFSEIAFFLSIRSGKKSQIVQITNQVFADLILCKNQSVKAYVAFLLCVWTPFINLCSLPGGFVSLLRDLIYSNDIQKIIAIQIICGFTFLNTMIIRHIYFIIRK